MKIVRSLYTRGVLLIALGALITACARPLVAWKRIVIDEFGFEFDYPYTYWYIEYEESTMREIVGRQVGEEATQELEGSNEGKSADLDAATYSVNLFDTTGSAEIHVATLPLSQENITAATISAAMQDFYGSMYPDYRVLTSKSVEVNHHDAFRRMQTYTADGPDGPQRNIVVVTDMIENDTVYQIVLIEHDWLDLPRNLKIYNHIVDTFHVR